jgi:hypothetical protein
MNRQPATTPDENPPCFGKHPSLIYAGCFSCARYVECCAAFGRGGVRVLPYVQAANVLTRAGDRRATDMLIHGLDASIFAAFRVVLTKYGLRVRVRTHAGYRAHVVDRDKKILFRVLRMDGRAAIIDAKRIDPDAAKHTGAVVVADARWRGHTPTYRFTFTTDIVRDMATRLDNVLALSYIAGTFTPGRNRIQT